MSLWTVLSLTSVVFVLVHVENFTSGQHPVPTTPRINSSRDLVKYTSNLRRELQHVEKALAPLKSKEQKLRQAYGQYSTRTARHGWASSATRRRNADHIRQDAIQLQSIAERFQRQLNKQLARQIGVIQTENFARFRDSKVSAQIEQTANVYKRIIELLVNMIECPIFILEQLGGEDGSSESTPSTTTDYTDIYPDYSQEYK